MDFVKLKELPKFWESESVDSDSKKFKAFKKRSEESCGIDSDINAMSFCPTSESSQLAVSCGSKVQIYDIGFSTVSENTSWSKHKNIVHCLSYRKDGKLLIAGDGDGAANIYDVSVSKSIIRRLRGHDGAVYAASFCSDNTRVVTAGKDQSVKVWEVPTGQVALSLRGHSDSVRSLLTLGDNCVISAGSDGQIIHWDIEKEGKALFCVSHGHAVDKLAAFESGALFFSFGGGMCRLWDVKTMSEVREAMILKHTKPVTDAVISKCGDFLATSSFDMTIKICRISSWEVIVSFASHSAVTAMAWKGNDLAIGTEKGRWTLRQRRHVSSLTSLSEEEESSSIVQSEERYYKTQIIQGPEQVSFKKESNADFMFRKFEYKKLIDFVVESNPSGPTALAIVDELVQRGGLLAAVRDRSSEEIIKILEWMTRNLVIDPRCSIQVVSQLFDALIETNSRTFAADPSLIPAVKSFNSRLSQEITLQLRAAALSGLLESLVSL